MWNNQLKLIIEISSKLIRMLLTIYLIHQIYLIQQTDEELQLNAIKIMRFQE